MNADLGVFNAISSHQIDWTTAPSGITCGSASLDLAQMGLPHSLRLSAKIEPVDGDFRCSVEIVCAFEGRRLSGVTKSLPAAKAAAAKAWAHTGAATVSMVRQLYPMKSQLVAALENTGGIDWQDGQLEVGT
jgi:hypothetical protein